PPPHPPPSPPPSLPPISSTTTPTPPTYTLSLHDALPISHAASRPCRTRRPNPGISTASCTTSAIPWRAAPRLTSPWPPRDVRRGDRKSTRLNSSHVAISYAVFCLKKKKSSVGS